MISFNIATLTTIAAGVILIVLIWVNRRKPSFHPLSAPSTASRYGSISSATIQRQHQHQRGASPKNYETIIPTNLTTLEATYRLMEIQHQAKKLDTQLVKSPTTDSEPSLAAQFSTLFPSYDPFDPSLPSLERFAHVRHHTHCIFARKSQVAGSADISTSLASLTVEEQVLAAIPGFVDFTLKVREAYPTFEDHADKPIPSFDPTDEYNIFNADTKTLLQWKSPISEFKLDAFVIEIDGAEHSSQLDSFAATIRTVLTTLSRCDVVVPSSSSLASDRSLDFLAAQCMSSIDHSSANSIFSSPRWHFTFLNETFFVTCFAPCYDRNHPRYQFVDECSNDAQRDVMSKKCYVLFQPELSFLRHNLSPDTPHTNWSHPKTERDRIRVAFKQAGRPYLIPPTVSYPAAHFIVPPLQPFSGQIIQWWNAKPKPNPTM